MYADSFELAEAEFLARNPELLAAQLRLFSGNNSRKDTFDLDDAGALRAAYRRNPLRSREKRRAGAFGPSLAQVPACCDR